MHPNKNISYEWHPESVDSHGWQATPNPPDADTNLSTTTPAYQATFDHHIQATPDSQYVQRQPFPNRYFTTPEAIGTQSNHPGSPISGDQSPWTGDPSHLTFADSPDRPLTIISPNPVRSTEFAGFGSSDWSSSNNLPSTVETYGPTQPQLPSDQSYQAYSPSIGPSSSYYPISISGASQHIPVIQASGDEFSQQHQYTALGPQGDTTEIVFPGRPVSQQRLVVRHRPTSAPYPPHLPNRSIRWPWDFPGRHSPSAPPSGQTMEHQDDALVPPTDTPLTVEHPDWKLTQETYYWMVATLDPKKRPNKKAPAPSGQCKLCASVCKRSGTLQQHIVILHRQKLARKVIAGQRYNIELALAFVVAQMRSDQGGASPDPESIQFTDLLASHPEGLPLLAPTEFPQLREKLMEFCSEERWIGVKCEHCGMMMSRRTALEEHQPSCPGRKSRRGSEPATLTADQSAGLQSLLTPFPGEGTSDLGDALDPTISASSYVSSASFYPAFHQS